MLFESLLSNRLPGPLAAAANRLLKIDTLEALYRSARSGSELCDELLKELRIDLKVTSDDLRKIPPSGPVIAVSNHPFGLLDGAVLASLLARVRRDIRVLTNRMLSHLPELASVGIFLDPFERPESRTSNARALKLAVAHLKNGGLLVIFPAGEVSHFDFRTAAVRDPQWRATAARLVRLTGAKTLPILICGTNSLPFQMLGMVHPRLRTAALPAELVNKRGKTVEVRIGSLIEPSQIALLPEDESAIRFLRIRTDLLARRDAVPGGPAPRMVPPAPVRPADLIAAEIGALPPDCRLVDDGREFTVYLAAADRIPLTLGEIGRLREVTFRAAGEGTGNPLDLDPFDRHYMHLFVWNRKKQQIVGAYRMGDVPALLSRFGRKGLYTNTLFRFSRGFLENLGSALELGRSFVRPEYQRQFAPLLLLWKGISAFVARRPHYSTLIGAVSVSNQYSRASRELIARYFENSRIAAVRGRRPLRRSLVPRWEIDALCSLVSNVDDLSDPIADLESDGKGIPVLIRQYLKLGGHLLAFSVDPRFGNTLDGFVMLDLTRTAPEILGRYMGQDRAKEFFAWHAAMTKRVA